MTEFSLPAAALQIGAGALAGGLAGALYFTALWWNVSLFEHGATPRALALLLLRFALLALVLIALAKLGALALLSGAAALLLARRLVIRRFGRLE